MAKLAQLGGHLQSHTRRFTINERLAREEAPAAVKLEPEAQQRNPLNNKTESAHQLFNPMSSGELNAKPGQLNSAKLKRATPNGSTDGASGGQQAAGSGHQHLHQHQLQHQNLYLQQAQQRPHYPSAGAGALSHRRHLHCAQHVHPVCGSAKKLVKVEQPIRRLKQHQPDCIHYNYSCPSKNTKREKQQLQQQQQQQLENVTEASQDCDEPDEQEEQADEPASRHGFPESARLAKDLAGGSSAAAAAGKSAPNPAAKAPTALVEYLSPAGSGAGKQRPQPQPAAEAPYHLFLEYQPRELVPDRLRHYRAAGNKGRSLGFGEQLQPAAAREPAVRDSGSGWRGRATTIKFISQIYFLLHLSAILSLLLHHRSLWQQAGGGAERKLSLLTDEPLQMGQQWSQAAGGSKRPPSLPGALGNHSSRPFAGADRSAEASVHSLPMPMSLVARAAEPAASARHPNLLVRLLGVWHARLALHYYLSYLLLTSIAMLICFRLFRVCAPRAQQSPATASWSPSAKQLPAPGHYEAPPTADGSPGFRRQARLDCKPVLIGSVSLGLVQLIMIGLDFADNLHADWLDRGRGWPVAYLPFFQFAFVSLLMQYILGKVAKSRAGQRKECADGAQSAIGFGFGGGGGGGGGDDDDDERRRQTAKSSRNKRSSDGTWRGTSPAELRRRPPGSASLCAGFQNIALAHLLATHILLWLLRLNSISLFQVSWDAQQSRSAGRQTGELPTPAGDPFELAGKARAAPANNEPVSPLGPRPAPAPPLLEAAAGSLAARHAGKRGSRDAADSAPAQARQPPPPPPPNGATRASEQAASTNPASVSRSQQQLIELLNLAAKARAGHLLQLPAPESAPAPPTAPPSHTLPKRTTYFRQTRPTVAGFVKLQPPTGAGHAAAGSANASLVSVRPRIVFTRVEDAAAGEPPGRPRAHGPARFRRPTPSVESAAGDFAGSGARPGAAPQVPSAPPPPPPQRNASTTTTTTTTTTDEATSEEPEEESEAPGTEAEPNAGNESGAGRQLPAPEEETSNLLEQGTTPSGLDEAATEPQSLALGLFARRLGLAATSAGHNRSAPAGERLGWGAADAARVQTGRERPDFADYLAPVVQQYYILIVAVLFNLWLVALARPPVGRPQTSGTCRARPPLRGQRNSSLPVDSLSLGSSLDGGSSGSSEAAREPGAAERLIAVPVGRNSRPRHRQLELAKLGPSGRRWQTRRHLSRSMDSTVHRAGLHGARSSSSSLSRHNSLRSSSSEKLLWIASPGAHRKLGARRALLVAASGQQQAVAARGWPAAAALAAPPPGADTPVSSACSLFLGLLLTCASLIVVLVDLELVSLVGQSLSQLMSVLLCLLGLCLSARSSWRWPSSGSAAARHRALPAPTLAEPAQEAPRGRSQCFHYLFLLAAYYHGLATLLNLDRRLAEPRQAPPMWLDNLLLARLGGHLLVHHSLQALKGSLLVLQVTLQAVLIKWSSRRATGHLRQVFTALVFANLSLWAMEICEQQQLLYRARLAAAAAVWLDNLNSFAGSLVTLSHLYHGLVFMQG